MGLDITCTCLRFELDAGTSLCYFPPETDWKFETRLPNNKGMVLPSLPIEPTFIYELGQARAIVGYALRRDHPDIQLLAYERM
jgi:hypothetical protein